MLAWILMALLTLPFQLSVDGDVVVPVVVDGQGPFRFLLDTGSSRSAISSRLAARLDLKAMGRTAVVTPAGVSARPLVALLQVRLGPLPPADVVVTVVAADDLRGAAGRDGIIGQDILASLVYTIDYERRLIEWHTGALAQGRGVRLNLTVSEGRMLVSLPQRDDAPAGLELIPDSGSDGLVFFARPGRTLPSLTPLDVAAIRTLAGHQLVRRVTIDEFHVGDIRLKDHAALVVPHGRARTIEADGLLPLHIFSRVTFNGPGRYLLIER